MKNHSLPMGCNPCYNGNDLQETWALDEPKQVVILVIMEMTYRWAQVVGALIVL